jgi:hypothetical protein
MKGLTLGLSQQVVKVGSNLTLVTQVRAGSSSDNAGTAQNCQMGRARQTRPEGVRAQEPVVEPPQVMYRLQPGGYGPASLDYSSPGGREQGGIRKSARLVWEN